MSTLKKKILCLIPARGGSKGIKNKNIKLFNNKPLIYWTIKEAIKAKIFDKIIVTTDSKKTREIALRYGAEVPFLRPKSISNDHSDALTVIQHSINFLEKNKLYFDEVFYLQPTSPLRKYNHILEAFHLYIKNHKKIDSLVSCQKLPHIFNPDSTFILKKNKIIQNSKVKEPQLRQKKNLYYSKNGAAIYILKTSIIKTSLLGKKTYYYEMDKLSSLDIDDQYDFDIGEFLIKKTSLISKK